MIAIIDAAMMMETKPTGFDGPSDFVLWGVTDLGFRDRVK
jgi:hypothetical protein